MLHDKVLLVILGGAIATWLPRVLPMVLLSRFSLPPLFLRWLRQVPVAVMAALLAQELLFRNGLLDPWGNRLELLAAIPATLVAIKTRSLLGTVVVGVISLLLLRLSFPV